MSGQGSAVEAPTPLCTFGGIMTAEEYIDILDQTLFPFLDEVFPDGHKFVQDNDPKHIARQTQQWMEEKNIN